MGNQLFKTFLLTFIVVAALLLLFFMPRLQIGDTMLRRVNILSDVEQRDSTGRILPELRADAAQGIREEAIDAAAVEVARVEYKDSVPEGMTAIEDFADAKGIHREMDKFYAALDHSRDRHVRVAYYGDSFIEGDILTAELRDLLQAKYGGRGVGWVDITSITAGFRTTVTHTQSGWTSHSANDAHGKGFDARLQGLSGHYFLPSGTGRVTLAGQKHTYGARLDTVDVATVYYVAGSNLRLSASLNGGEAIVLHSNTAYALPPEEAFSQAADSTEADSGSTHGEPAATGAVEAASGGRLMSEALTGRIGRFEMRASGNGRFFGVALEGRDGISVDNFSMRGSNGWFIADIPDETMRQFADKRPYDLIVVHYGLNIASKKTKDYSYYTNRMVRAIGKLQRCFPGASILVVGISDRDQRTSDGGLHTMPGVAELSSYQRKMASDCRVSFWNLYEAMGGDGSMARMKEQKEANLDYTHINFAGGKRVAKIFFDVLMNGKDNFDKRTKNL